MPARPTRSAKRTRRSLTPEDRADLAASRRTIRQMEETGEKPIPWAVVEAELAELREREDEAAVTERERKRRIAFGRRSGTVMRKPASGARRRAAGGKRQR